MSTRNKLILGICLLVNLIYPSFALVIFSKHLWAQHQLEQRTEMLRAEDLLVSLEELDASYTLPAGEVNAADYYQKAFDSFPRQYEELTEEEKRLLPIEGYFEVEPCESLPEENRIAIENYLEVHKETLTWLHEAAVYPHARYPIAFNDAMDIPLPHLKKLRHACCVLSLESISACTQNALNTALNAFVTSVAAAESLKNEPGLISQLVRNVALAITIPQLEWILSTFEDCGESLVPVQRYLLALDFHPALRKAITDELSFLTTTHDYAIAEVHERFVADWAIKAGMNHSAYQFFGFLHELVQKSDVGWQETLPFTTPYTNRPEETEDKLDYYYGWYNHFARATHFFLSRETECHLAGVACAVARYRQAQGGLPDTLEALVPTYIDEIPIDPWSNAPVLYEQCEPGYIIYSVGPDGVDQGGKGREDGEPFLTGAYDIVFNVCQ